MDKLRKIFVVAMICLVVSTIAVYAVSHSYLMTAPVQPPSVVLYDTSWNTILTPKAWSSPVYEGFVLTLWVNNTSQVPVIVTPSINSEVNCSITLSPNTGFTLPSKTGQQLTLTFTTITAGATGASWILNLDYP